MTGLVRQLEQEELVSRTPLSEDRRTYQVGLTRKGRAHFAKMAEQHEAWVVGLFAGMDHDQQEALMHSLGDLKRSIHRDRG